MLNLNLRRTKPKQDRHHGAMLKKRKIQSHVSISIIKAIKVRLSLLLAISFISLYSRAIFQSHTFK